MLAKALVLGIILGANAGEGRSFGIDYTNDQFLMDGKPFRFISGTIHSFQVPHHLWHDRLMKLRAMGCNVLQTYIAWHQHQPLKGEWHMEGRTNLTEWLSIAQELGLHVILRLGPYMDAEQDMGGFPAWLLKDRDIRLRTSDARYTNAVEQYYNKLLPEYVKPMLYPNGGPVIMVQVENEYGSYYACDRKYTHWLLALVKRLLNTSDIIYFTDDGGAVEFGVAFMRFYMCEHFEILHSRKQSIYDAACTEYTFDLKVTLEQPHYLKCGPILPGSYPMVDFGVTSCKGVNDSFEAMRSVAPHGPLANVEFYPGWFDMWGFTHCAGVCPALEDIIVTMNCMYGAPFGASFNIYMTHGGTNWGYQAGAETTNGPFTTITTSYDFNAPIDESGQLTEHWYAFKQTIERLTNKHVPYPTPTVDPLVFYGRVKMVRVGNLWDLLSTAVSPNAVVRARYPPSVEDIDHPYGFVLYQTKVTRASSTIDLSMIHDRGYVVVNGALVAKVQRPHNMNMTSVQVALKPGDNLQIVIENQGRICYGTYINDTKGIVRNVTVDEQFVLENWTVYPLNLTNTAKILSSVPEEELEARALQSTPNNDDKFLPCFHVGRFVASPVVGHTYVDTTGWGKGQAFTDQGVNLGRYWPIEGPQLSLYHPFVHNGTNTLVFFEMEQAADSVLLTTERRYKA